MADSTRPLNVCTIAYSFYETDTRIRRYTEALAERGDYVDVIALSDKGSAPYELIKGVHVHRIQERLRNEEGRFSYLSRLLRFLVNSAVFASRRHLRIGYDFVHVHSVPDFEVFAALLPKLSGSRVILDIHDIVPEFYASKFGVTPNSFTYKALKLLEKISVGFSDHVIVANHIWEKTLLQRSAKRDKCTALLNYPDTSIFYRRALTNGNGNPLFVYPGSLNWHQGLDIAIKAFALARGRISGAQFHIYGEGPEENALRGLVDDLGLGESVRFHSFLPLTQIAEIMAGATVAVVPKRNDPFGGDAFSTKVFEFMALGVPVILSRTRVDEFYFNDSLVHFFEPENSAELADAIISLASDENRRNVLSGNALEFINDLCWDRKKQDYFRLVDKLVGQG
jgi:glycosyltransferase involved in cell wall biosynthesis